MNATPELRRGTQGHKLAGVCVGFADRWQIDPLLVRIAVIVLALSGGIGLVLYAAAWLAIPPAGSNRALIDGVLPGARQLPKAVWVTVVGLVCLIVGAILGTVLPFGFTPAIVMAAVWYFGYYRPQKQREARQIPPKLPQQVPPSPFTASTPFTDAAAAWQQRVQAYLNEHPPRQHSTFNEHSTFKEHPMPGPAPRTAPPLTQQVWPTRVRETELGPGVRPQATDPGYSRDAFLAIPDPVGLYDPEVELETAPVAPTQVPQRRRTGRMHIILWSLIVAFLTTLGILDISRDVPFAAYPAAILLAIGITMFLGTWLTRPRGLFIAALILTLVTGLASADLARFEGEPTVITYGATLAQPAEPVVHEFGDLTIDLSDVRLTEDADYSVSLEAGVLVIILPPDTNAEIEWTMEAGEVVIDGDQVGSGFEIGSTTRVQGSDPDGPTLHIKADAELGKIEVRR